MQKITPFLWFDNQLEEAVNFYTAIFKNSKIHSISRYNDGREGESGTVTTASFQLEGQQFMGLNGGPAFQFTNAISFFVDCKDQAEVDDLWSKLLADGGQEQQCGWLTDRFGVSWQIIPSVFMELIGDQDPEKAGRVMQAMLQMVKLDIQGLRDAYEGK